MLSAEQMLIQEANSAWCLCMGVCMNMADRMYMCNAACGAGEGTGPGGSHHAQGVSHYGGPGPSGSHYAYL